MKKNILILACISTCLSLYAQDETVNGNLDVTGNIGIGIANPTEKLHINTGINEVKTYLHGAEITTKTTGGWARGFRVRNETKNQNVAFGGYNGMAYIATDFDVNQDASGYLSIKLAVKPDGKIGIGTNTPSAKLSILSNDSRFITLEREGAAKKGHIGYGFAGGGGIYLGTEDTPYSLYIQQNGDMGIGTYNPSTKLSILSNESRFITLEREGVSKKGYIGFGANNGGSIYLGTDESQYSLYVQQNGDIGIGTYNPDEKLSVNGKIKTKEVIVSLTGWSDFVFKKSYNLPTLEEVENHINTKGHLKDIPSEAEVLKNGIEVGEMNSKLLQKIEELTLYTIEQEKEINAQKEELANLKELKKVVNKQESEIKKLTELVNQLVSDKQ